MTEDMLFLRLFAHFLIFFLAFAFEEPQPVMVGGDAFLQCQAPKDAVVTVLEWSKTDLSSDDYVFFYRNDRSYEKYQHASFRGRVELSDPSMKNGDVSIVLKNVTVSDDGTYRCRIITSNTGSSQRVFGDLRSLRVTDQAEQVSQAVGRLEKAVQKEDGEEAGSGAPVAVGVGAVCGVVALIAAVAFVVIRKRHKYSKSHNSQKELKNEPLHI